MLKIIFWILFALLEIPFTIKFVQAHRNFELIRQVAIIIIMLIIAGVFCTVVRFAG